MSEKKMGADVVVVGAGVIGLAIALEMHRRGARVVILERGEAMRQASIAAAGMLAVNDPGNPTALLPLATLSAELYPAFLRTIEALSGMQVPFQTETALQYGEDGGVVRLAERSIDPRQLGVALAAAVRATSIVLMERAEIAAVEEFRGEQRILVSGSAEVSAASLVYAAGAWSSDAVAKDFSGNVPIAPRKGQMLRVQVPRGLALSEVHRSERVYIVPRTAGPQAGTALIGATVEDAGFDMTVHTEDLSRLRKMAAELLPELELETDAPTIEAWAGLRPATPDDLPLLGAVGAGRFIASGHYRNGILMAPATAVVMADMLMGLASGLDLSAFLPNRFP